MSSIPATFSDPVHELRYRIADLLANIETENDGLDPRTATLALLETAYGAALTFCTSPDRARRHVGAAVDQIHAGTVARRTGPSAGDSTTPSSPARGRRGSPPPAAPLAGRLFLAITVAVLSWATIVFLAHRGPVSPWNLLGPLFCTALALVTAYRFLVSGGYMRPWWLFSRGQRLRAL
jgi:hypothetical protein